MRVQRLDLIAYGPFSGTSLDLSTGDAGLHVVYGDNEAGKSTSLRALIAWLFGIPARTDDDFLHKKQQLRVGGMLHLSSGDDLAFVRRKGNKGTLLHPESGDPLDESVRRSLQDAIQAKDGSAAAAEASEDAEQHLAAVVSGAEQYLRLKIAALILEEQIERYRRANQAPVLSRAGELFRRLTLGAFDGLRDELDDRGKPVLLGVRPDDGEVGVAEMSDGSRDQLFLALRLATLMPGSRDSLQNEGTMPSFTLKKVPEALMDRLRQQAQRNRRSLAKEMLQLLEVALEASAARETTPRYHATVHTVDDRPLDRDAQVKAWRDLCGQWQSDLDPEEEIEAIYAARTAGREVDL